VILAPGTKLGPYELVAPIGAGGMGEVWRAKDPRLSRDVAVKVLPASFASDPDRLRRLEQEARAAGQLNHPNVLTVFDVGSADGTTYVVSELLEGETLRQALAAGRPATRKALDWSVQIARGLAAAHDKGIVHRDLKPENVFVTRDGRIKILDFGLAKLTQAPDGPSESNRPTALMGTEPGMVLGTVGYMAPEQVRGQPADTRADLFSFGAMLYEMLSGQRAFKGDSAADILSAILREEPTEISQANHAVPPGLDRVIRRCLEKAPEQRFQSAGDLAFALESLSTDSAVGPVAPGIARPRVVMRRAALFAAAAVLLVAGFFGGRLGQKAPAAPSLLFERLTSEPGVERSPALSSDGENVAYTRVVGGRTHIFVQRVGSDKPVDLSADSQDSDSDPAFSPDGSLISFRSTRDGVGGIFVMGPLGESIRRVTTDGYGPVFTPDSKEIVFAEEPAGYPLARGGNRSHIWAVEIASEKKRMIFGPDAMEPAVSPHGHRVAFWGLVGMTAQRDVWTVPLRPKEGEKPVPVTSDAAADFSPFWSGDGSFLYFGSDRGGSFNLWRVAIDEASGVPRGAPEPVTLPVTWAGAFPGAFSGSGNGKRIAFTAPAEQMTVEKLALDPGTHTPIGPPVVIRRSSTSFEDLQISPDDGTLATRTVGRVEDLCLVSIDGQKLRHVTDDEFRDRAPVFAAGGSRLVFYSDRGGDYGVYSIATDGSGLSPLLPTGSAYYRYPTPSPDGRFLAVGARVARRVAVFPLVAGAGGSLSVGAQVLFEFESRWPWSWSRDSTRVLAAGPEFGWDLLKLSAEVLLCTPEKKTCEGLGIRANFALFTPDGRSAILTAADGIRVVDLASRTSPRTSRLIHPAPDGTLARIALSADGRSLYFLRNVTEGDIWVGTFR
jgi:Tol biopolymer transport system component